MISLVKNTLVTKNVSCNSSFSLSLLLPRLVTTEAKVKTRNIESEKYKSSHAEEWENALPYEKIPGPKLLSAIRSFLPGGKFYKVPRVKMMKMMVEEYGRTIRFPGFLGKADVVVVHDPPNFEKVFRNEGIWPNRRGLDSLVYYRTVKNPEAFMNIGGLLAEQNEEWGKFRSIVNPVLMQPRTIRIYAPRMNKVADEFIEKIHEIRDKKTQEVPKNFEEIINLWTLESVSVVALDTHLGLLKNTEENADAKKLIKALEKFFSLSVDLDINPSLWKYVRTPKYSELMQAFDDLTEVSGKYINEALDRYEKNSIDDNRNENDKSVLERLLKHDKKVAVVMATDMLMAGVDTTTSAFVGCLLALAKNPIKQEKLRKEILEILPNKNSPLTSENMKNLPYLRACIKESLRVFPVVQGNMRKIAQDVVIDGYRIPKGTDVAMMTTEYKNTEYAYEKENEFIPERWLRTSPKNKNECPAEAAKSSHAFAFLPFGFGPRSCIGKRVVEMEIEIALAKIVRNFQVEFNYPAEDVFELKLIFVPNKELKFKFIDIDN